MIKTDTSARDGETNSVWQKHNAEVLESENTLSDRDIFDCVIVGGGITGLTAAFLLQSSGKKIVVVDAHNPGFGTTGGTSAHINTFADTTYKEAENAFGKDGAQLFADAVVKGLKLIEDIVGSNNIACDYEVKNGYLYAENDDEVKQINDIYDGAINVGINVSYTDTAPTNVPFKKALLFPDQAQFHPLKYLSGLVKLFINAGGVLLENTLVTDVISNNDLHLVKHDKGEFNGATVIYATHIPPNVNVFNFECAPYRSYVIAVKLKNGNYPDALIYDSQEPYHYVRTHIINNETLLLIGGLDHKTGHGDPDKAFTDLEDYARRYYDISSVEFNWSSQYYIPVDGLPYIGQMPLTTKGIYCATGYNGNGMMLGSIAGRILADIVGGIGSKFEKLFSPSRIKPIDSFTEFVKENADVAYHFVADRFGIQKNYSFEELNNDEGLLIEVDGKKVAVYRDLIGDIHALNPVCTHAACIVNWNSEEKSWDCPCHGARYDIDGNVLTGPATKNLETLVIERP